MKKTMVRLMATLLALLALFAFVGCDKTQDASGSCTVVVGEEPEKVYEVSLDDVTVENGLMSVLEYLKEKKGLSYTSNDTGYGAYLTSVGALQEDSSTSTYIFIYTSVEADFDVSAMATTKDYKGTTLTSAGVGASSMTIQDGAIYYIGTVKY